MNEELERRAVRTHDDFLHSKRGIVYHKRGVAEQRVWVAKLAQARQEAGEYACILSTTTRFPGVLTIFD